MPRYEFISKDSGDIEVHYMSISELESFISNNKHLKQVLCLPRFVDPIRLGIKKPSDSHREILKNIKEGNPGSTIEV